MYEHVCRPDFIIRFLETFDLGLVLDLAHAEVTAANLNLSFWDYISALPLERVAEIHLSRTHVNRFVTVDAHLAPENEDFSRLEQALDLLPREACPTVAIEYYGDLKILENLYHRLGQMAETRGSEAAASKEAAR